MCVCVCACVRACVRECVRACVRACVRGCVRACVRAYVYVTVNAKNNFGDTLEATYNIACARSVSDNVDLLLKYSYVVEF